MQQGMYGYMHNFFNFFKQKKIVYPRSKARSLPCPWIVEASPVGSLQGDTVTMSLSESQGVSESHNKSQ